ncbi:MAG TPA: hypothetical protein VGH81_02595 [Rudaea sp.]
MKLLRPRAALEKRHENLLHNAPRIQCTSIPILRTNAVLMHSTHGMLACTKNLDASTGAMHPRMDSMHPIIDFRAAMIKFCPTMQD